MVKVVDFDGSFEQIEEDDLPMVKIQDEFDQFIERSGAEHRTLSKEVPEAAKAEVEIHQSTSPLLISELSMEDGILPSPKLTIEEEGKIQAHIGQDKDAVGCTMSNIKRKVTPAKDPRMKLDFIKKLLAFVITCLTSCCKWESLVCSLPKM
ncbi:hypothetical protein OROGR_028769 [Orobanche gracilis]